MRKSTKSEALKKARYTVETEGREVM